MKHYYDSRGKPGYKRLTSVVVDNIPIRLYVMEGLFSSKGIDEGTRLLLENMVIPKQGMILDMGCGTGIIGIYALLKNPHIRAYFVDVNPAAIKLSKLNARINSVDDRAEFAVSDLYSKLKGMKFTAIYTNPPLSAGWEVIRKMIMYTPMYLHRGGWMQAVFSKGEDKAIRVGKEVFREVKIVKRKKGYSILLFAI